MLNARSGLLNAEKHSTEERASPALRSVAVVVVIVSLITVFFTMVFGAVVLSRVNSVHQKLEDAHLNVGPTTRLPARYHVPYTATTPAKDQGRRGTCWVFSTIGVLESSYRKHGYEHGWLSEDEYVSFSEQAYGIGMVRYCQSHKTDPYCFAGPAKNVTGDGEAEWLYYMRAEIPKYVLPTSVCPYQSQEKDQFTCPGLDEAVNKNPLKFTVKGLETAYTVDSIKRLIYKHQSPLAWSHGVFQATFTVPCDDLQSALATSEQCLKCYHPCTTSFTGCCAEITVPGYTQEGVFALHSTPYMAGGHAMLVVGWNDDFRVDTGLPGNKGHHTTGGFIIKNSWNTDVGHSVGYWAQDHSIMEENFICPCEASAKTWIPVKAQCMLDHNDLAKCCSLEKNVLKEWVKGATVLKCKTTDPARMAFLGWSGCRSDMNYALAALDSRPSEPWTVVPKSSDGYVRFKIVEWNPANRSIPATIVETNASTWYGIENLLTPVSIKGNTNNCGVYFLPYETLSEGNIVVGVAGHDTPAASYIDVQWEKTSFARSGKRGSGDYSMIDKSTIHYKPTVFTGPFDFAAK